MALLNYAELLNSELRNQYITNLQKPAVNAEGVRQGDWAKILFTGDGHIISHGVDFTPTFEGGKKGLVPESTRLTDLQANADAKFKFLGNDGYWKELTVAELPIADSISVGGNPDGSGANYIYTAKQVFDNFHAQLDAVNAMRFVGTFSAASNSNNKPTSCLQGDTYRISNGGEFAGYVLSQGDLVIALKDSKQGDDVDSDEFWTAIETNINGTVTHMINNTPYNVYSDEIDAGDSFTIFAPKTAGTQGHFLISEGTGKAPVWKDIHTLDILNSDLKDAILTNVTLTNDGTLKLTDLAGNTTASTTATGDWNINILGSAHKVDNPLTLANGLAFRSGTTQYDGSSAQEIVLTPATKSVIGGVIVDNLTGDDYKSTYGKEKAESTISVTQDGVIYLTAQNVFSALGYKPGVTENVNEYSYFFAKNADDIKSAELTSATANPYFNLNAYNPEKKLDFVAASVRFMGSDGLDVSATKNQINFSLGVASADHLGAIKIGYEENSTSRKYAVKLDANNRAYVDVPWVDETPAFSYINVYNGNTSAGKVSAGPDVADTFEIKAGDGLNVSVSGKVITFNADTWEVVTPTKIGFAPAMVGTTTEIDQQHYVLSYKGNANNPTWNKVPVTAFSDTWRNIKVNGVEILSSTIRLAGSDDIVANALNFIGAGKTTIEGNANGNVTISSTWRTIKHNNVEVGVDASLKFVDTDSIMIASNDTADETTLGFELVWTNLTDGATEIS